MSRSLGLKKKKGEPVGEKGLILAHAEARRTVLEGAPSRAWLFIGVAVSAVIVCMGWLVTFGSSMRSGMFGESEGLLDIVRGRSRQLRQELEVPVEGAKETFQAFEANRVAEEAVLARVAEEIHRGQASSTTQGVSTTSTAVTSTRR